MLILARDAGVGERNGAQGSRRELSRELSRPRPESWRAKLLGAAFAALVLASAILLLSDPGDEENAGGDGVLLYPTAHLTQLTAAHVRETTHRDTLDAEKATRRAQLVAGRHHPYIKKGAG